MYCTIVMSFRGHHAVTELYWVDSSTQRIPQENSHQLQKLHAWNDLR